MASLHVLNKQDYARWHSYGFALITQTIDPDVHYIGGQPGGPMNKLGALARLLSEVPPDEAGWLLYLGFDLMIDDISFTFPFESYAGKDLVLVGDKAKVLAGDGSALDVGAVLVRNSLEARKLVGRLAQVAVETQAPTGDAAYKSDPLAAALISLLASDPALADRVRFETDFCMACDWRRIDLAASSKVWVGGCEVWEREGGGGVAGVAAAPAGRPAFSRRPPTHQPATPFLRSDHHHQGVGRGEQKLEAVHDPLF